MNLEDLKEPIPFKWRVQSFSKKKAQASCVSYIDARDAQNILDEVCGQGNWQSEYYEAAGLLFCRLGIKVGSEWVWKSDTGKESYIEKEKGHASDAYKRACVHWGIGRFLYELGTQYCKADMKQLTGQDKNYPSVIDDKGKKVWNLTAHINSRIEKPLSGFLKKMKKYAEDYPKIYKKYLEKSGMVSAKNFKNPESQMGVIKEIEYLIKGE